jgi:hypothetical protein
MVLYHAIRPSLLRSLDEDPTHHSFSFLSEEVLCKTINAPSPLTRSMLTMCSVGSREEAHPPHSEAPARNRRCITRRDQRAPHAATGSPQRSPAGRNQGGEGEEGRSREREEGREGEVCEQGGVRTGEGRHCQQAGSQGRAEQGEGYDEIRSGCIATRLLGFSTPRDEIGVVEEKLQERSIHVNKVHTREC